MLNTAVAFVWPFAISILYLSQIIIRRVEFNFSEYPHVSPVDTCWSLCVFFRNVFTIINWILFLQRSEWQSQA